MSDLIERQMAIDYCYQLINVEHQQGSDEMNYGQERVNQTETILHHLELMPSAQPEEVIPHRNYKYLSDYWCECGWHLGKKGEVKYCSECGRKVNWDG